MGVPGTGLAITIFEESADAVLFLLLPQAAKINSAIHAIKKRIFIQSSLYKFKWIILLIN
jgi:hypothetical protein